MTIEEAIEIAQSPESLAIVSLDPDLKDAVKLGIEAMKAIQDQRNRDVWLGAEQLPGETKE